MGERQKFNSADTIRVNNCSNNVKVFLTFDTNGDVITSEGKNGNLYVIPKCNCIFGSTIHLQAEGSEVDCRIDCPKRVKQKLLQI